LNLDRFLGKKYAILMARQEARDLEAKRGPVNKTMHFLMADRDGSLPPIAVFEECGQGFLKALLNGLPLSERDIDIVASSESHFAFNRRWLGRRLTSWFPNAAVFTDIEHHAIHAYQAFYSSGFENAAVLTADACGEPLKRLNGKRLAMTLSHAAGNNFQSYFEHRFPESSPGRVYASFNAYLGFSAGEEGKTMGLSAYGKERCHLYLAPHLKLFEDGSFRFLDNAELSAALLDYGAKPRHPTLGIKPIHADIAFAAQRLLDEIMCNAVRALKRLSPSRSLCLAGGVALNSVSNERCFSGSGFKQLYIMPNAGDSGQALGCALYAERVLIGGAPRLLPHDGLGPAYADDLVQAELLAAGLEPTRRSDLSDYVASLIERGCIVGWFQGGSEYGPRALGNRSILADCRSASMKDYLNARVKHREPFRPYAPAVLEEEAAGWFELCDASPFMLRVVDVKASKRALIPAATHVDGTARVQTVGREANPHFHALIRAFYRRTGIPIILNTSFNIAGKPMVETPRDAIECFQCTQIDVLVIHDFVIEKRRDLEAMAAGLDSMVRQ
jgi:carbamoyltransferase